MILLERNGIRKEVSTGFSWKILFFGAFYPLCRNIGDTKGFFIVILVGMVTLGFAFFVFPFTHNNKFLERKMIEGWSVVEDFDINKLKG